MIEIAVGIEAMTGTETEALHRSPVTCILPHSWKATFLGHVHLKKPPAEEKYTHLWVRMLPALGHAFDVIDTRHLRLALVLSRRTPVGITHVVRPFKESARIMCQPYESTAAAAARA